MPAVVPVAGAGMMIGYVVALFYAEASVAGLRLLLLAGLGLIAIGIWIERIRTRTGDRPWHGPVLLFGSMAAVCALQLAVGMPLATEPRLPHWLVIVSAMLTPFAFVSMPWIAQRPSLPSTIALTQVLLMGLLMLLASRLDFVSAAAAVGATAVMLGPFEGPEFGAFVGTLLGSLIYVCRMPWRTAAIASCSVTARLIVGLVIAWAALAVSRDAHVSSISVDTALIWLLAIPIFEFVGSAIAALRLAPAQSAGLPPGTRVAPSGADPSSTRMLLSALLLGAIGIGLWQGDLSANWSVAAWFAALLAYVTRAWWYRAAARPEGGPTIDRA
ncbi:MAG: hypothetical protein ABWZ78_02360 [Burkholderiaceae bacterium]